ncbi:MAG: hypothetical protein CMD12_06240 [Flavobacteriales bacterium]|nr:hypothetical protein [Flavobacteriales bacterium]|tara:strand:- start:329 stop:574 length:246 start_codon:yes stop_codon:yes gene_type:complete
MKRFISFVCILVLSLFLSVSECLSEEVGGQLNNNVSKESNLSSIKSKNNAKTDIPKPSNEDIFGDEQAFPFIAGLGKNAAH